MALERRDISLRHFTREFPGREIESKWKLLTENPVPFLLSVRSDILQGSWQHYSISYAMGELPLGVRYFEMLFEYWGVSSHRGMKQVAMTAGVPSLNRYQIAFKFPSLAREEMWRVVPNPPLVREERRKGDWLQYDQVWQVLQAVEPRAVSVGRVKREKCSVYITSNDTLRNFSLSADKCTSQSGHTISQLEVEYKGRNGCWLEYALDHSLEHDFSRIHSILSSDYGDCLEPTRLTKFEWLVATERSEL